MLIGLSGKILIHICPSRFICRVTACLAASICLPVIHASCKVLIPNEPKARVYPLLALPFIFPFWLLLNFVFFGCNISFSFRMLKLFDHFLFSSSWSSSGTLSSNLWGKVPFTNYLTFADPYFYSNQTYFG